MERCCYLIFLSVARFSPKNVRNLAKKISSLRMPFRVCCTRRVTRRLQIVIEWQKKIKKFFPRGVRKSFLFFYDKAFFTLKKINQRKKPSEVKRSTILTIGKICVRLACNIPDQNGFRSDEMRGLENVCGKRKPQKSNG